MPAKSHLTNPTGFHISEKKFRRFEQWFEALRATYPEKLVIVPSGIAPITFADGIRSAANSFLTNNYGSHIDRDRFAAVWNKCKVSIVGDEVWVCDRKTKPVTATAVDAIAGGTSAYFTELSFPTLAQLTALIGVYDAGVTTIPSLIRGALPEGFVAPPTVVVQPNEDGTWTMF